MAYYSAADFDSGRLPTPSTIYPFIRPRVCLVDIMEQNAGVRDDNTFVLALNSPYSPRFEAPQSTTLWPTDFLQSQSTISSHEFQLLSLRPHGPPIFSSLNPRSILKKFQLPNLRPHISPIFTHFTPRSVWKELQPPNIRPHRSSILSYLFNPRSVLKKFQLPTVRPYLLPPWIGMTELDPQGSVKEWSGDLHTL
jgi:hypothetical protein